MVWPQIGGRWLTSLFVRGDTPMAGTGAGRSRQQRSIRMRLTRASEKQQLGTFSAFGLLDKQISSLQSGFSVKSFRTKSLRFNLAIIPTSETEISFLGSIALYSVTHFV